MNMPSHFWFIFYSNGHYACDNRDGGIKCNIGDNKWYVQEYTLRHMFENNLRPLFHLLRSNESYVCQNKYSCPSPATETPTSSPVTLAPASSAPVTNLPVTLSPVAPAICFPNAHRVKIQSNTKWPIQVFEVSVMSGGSNVAQGKSATQGSTWNDKPWMAASSAIDGNNSTFSHTGMNGCDWLEINLGGSYPISSISFLNRYCKDTSDPHGCLCRLSHATVSLLTDAGEWVDGTWLGDTCGALEVSHGFTGHANFCS